MQVARSKFAWLAGLAMAVASGIAAAEDRRGSAPNGLRHWGVGASVGYEF
jgi:hypothetical protein